MADPSEKLHSARMMDDQEADARPIVAGPPPYNDPNNPDAIGNTMFDLSKEGSGGGPSQEGDPVPVATTTPGAPASTDDLDEMTKDELMEKAAGLEIKGRSSMNKEELADAIAEAEADGGGDDD